MMPNTFDISAVRTRSVKFDQKEVRLRKMVMVGNEGNIPSTLNETKRSVEAVIATDTDEVKTWHPDVGTVPEILIPSGCRHADQVPIIDTHNRWSVGAVLGSTKDIRATDSEVFGTAYFSEVEAAENAFTLVREGHVTDFSAGYCLKKILVLQDDEIHEIGGRTYEGPAVLGLEWELKELSLCPVGADAKAKARASEYNKQEESDMKWLKRMAKMLGLPEDTPEAQVREAVEKEIAQRTDAGESFEELIEPKSGKRSEQDDDGKIVSMETVRTIVKDELSEQRQASMENVREINELCKAHGMEDKAGDMIARGLSVERAQAEVLKTISERTDQGEYPGYGVITMGAQEVDKVREVLTDSILIRAGVSLENPADGFGDFVGMQLREVCRELLMRSGQSYRGNPMEMIGRAMSSSDLPNILSNVANKALFAGYEGAEETYEAWVDTTGTFADFNPKTIAKLGKLGSLREVKEGGEYKNVTISDEGETVKAIKFGEIMPITMEMIMNDDLDALTALPGEMGEAAATTLGDLAYAVLTANAKMGDNIALFHTSSHKNVAGTVGAPGSDTIAEMILKMGKQKAPGGKRNLNIKPQFVIAPLALEGSSEEFFATKDIVDADTNETRKNIYAGRYTRVYDARLDDDSEVSWYAQGRKGKGVKMFFLNGVKAPQVLQRDGWRVDGLQLKIMLVAAAKAMDWRYLYKNGG